VFKILTFAFCYGGAVIKPLHRLALCSMSPSDAKYGSGW
jgi:hypothetical protein